MARSITAFSPRPLQPYHTSPVPGMRTPTVSSHADDGLLLQRIAVQDRQAFDAFYTRYAPRLRGYLARLLSDQALVNEVCNDVMLVVWQQATRVPTTVPVWAWLCGIARRKARKAWARMSSHAVVPAGPADSQAAAPEALLLQQESKRVLDQSLDRLPFYERTALVLLVQHGYSYQDIAAVMDTSVSTVRTRLWRACHRLHAHVTAVDRPAWP